MIWVIANHQNLIFSAYALLIPLKFCHGGLQQKTPWGNLAHGDGIKTIAP
jgi:hypothetical protein